MEDITIFTACHLCIRPNLCQQSAEIEDITIFAACHLCVRTHLQELEPVQEVVDVGAQRFEGGVGPLGPHGGLLADQQALGQGLQVGRHHHQPLDGLLHVLQRRPDDAQQPGKQREEFVTTTVRNKNKNLSRLLQIKYHISFPKIIDLTCFPFLAAAVFIRLKSLFTAHKL